MGEVSCLNTTLGVGPESKTAQDVILDTNALLCEVSCLSTKRGGEPETKTAPVRILDKDAAAVSSGRESHSNVGIEWSSGTNTLEDEASNAVSKLQAPKYIGESSRPLRLRVKEHYKNLENLKIESFMLQHWMDCHGDSMVPPEFQFKVISSYKDSMSRQLSEALLIEKEGSLNRKMEYGSNHICRLESSVSGWEQERIGELEAWTKANRISNLKCFVSTIQNVISICKKLTPCTNTDQDSTCRYTKERRKRQVDERIREESFDHQIKKRRMANTSTPKWEYRVQEDPNTSSIDLSPVYSLGSTLESLGSSFNDSQNKMTHCSVGLSPQLRKLLIRPRNEEEEYENKRILVETINLTRAALARGLIQGDYQKEMEERLTDNALFKPVGMWNVDMGLVLQLDSLYLDPNIPRVQPSSPNIRTRKTGVLMVVDSFKNWDLEYEEMAVLKEATIMERSQENNGIDMGNSPILRSTRKRSLSPSNDTQLGTLAKHTTVLKKSQEVRKKLNQTFFVGSPSGGYCLSSNIVNQGTPDCHRKKKSVRRRLNPDTKQLLITSTFSPKQKLVSSGPVPVLGDVFHQLSDSKDSTVDLCDEHLPDKKAGE